MSFTARQLHCMHAMGLVAWTRNRPVEQTPMHPVGDAGAVQAVTQGVTVDSDVASVAAPAGDSFPPSEAQGSLASMPVNIESLTQWLAGQSLSMFSYRGANVTVVGPEQASLLVVCINRDMKLPVAPDLQPLNAECAQLLKLMLHAINLSMTDIRQCLVSEAGLANSESGDSTPDTIKSVCTHHTRGVLLLDPGYDDGICQAASDACLMPASSLPLWRIPHPDCLLENPALKRTAWENLKALKQSLAQYSQQS